MRRLLEHVYVLAVSFAVGMALYLVADWLAWRIQADPPERRCRMCGCTDGRACAGGCYWIGADFCSRCLLGPDDEPGGGW